MEINRRKHAHAIKKILFESPSQKKNLRMYSSPELRQSEGRTDSSSHTSARRTGSSEMPRIVCCLAGPRQQ